MIPNLVVQNDQLMQYPLIIEELDMTDVYNIEEMVHENAGFGEDDEGGEVNMG